MLTLIIGLLVPIMATILTIFTLATKPQCQYYTFFRFLPSVRLYFKALRAINSLEVGSLVVKDRTSMDAQGEAILTIKDEGFKELVLLLKKEAKLLNKGEVEKLVLWELSPGPNSPIHHMHFQSLNATINGKDSHLIGPFDAQAELREIAEVFVQRKITTVIIVLAILILVLSTFYRAL